MLHMPQPTGKRLVLFVSLILFIATWLVYANSLGNDFAFDDAFLIQNNQLISTDTSLKEIFSSTYWTGTGRTDDGLYRPLSILTFIWNGHGNISNPFPFHFFNVTINALNTVLLFLFLLIVSGDITLSFCAALLFGFHPIHTEVVANISGRPEFLYTFFLLIAWILLEKYREQSWSSTVAALFFLPALFSKETAAMFPFLVIANDFAHRRQLFSKASVLRYLPIFFALGVYLFIRMWVMTANPPCNFSKLDNFIAYSPFEERLSTAFSILPRYLYKMFFPVRLSCDYSFFAIPSFHTFINPLSLIGIAGLAGMVAMLFCRRNPLIALSTALFLFPYLVVSNIFFPIGAIMAERYLYLPVAGFALGLAIIIRPFLNQQRIAAIFVFLLIILAYSILTIRRNADWRDDSSLFNTDIAVAPFSFKVNSMLAKNLYEHGRFDEATRYAKHAVEIYPDDPDGQINYAINLIAVRHYEEAISAIGKAEELGGSDSVILNTGALAYFLSGDISSAHRLLTIAESENVAMDENLANAIRTAVNEQEKGALP